MVSKGRNAQNCAVPCEIMNEARHLEEHPVPDRTMSPLSAWERGELPTAPRNAEWLHHRLKKRVRFSDIYSENRARIREENRILQNEAAGVAGASRRREPAPAPTSGAEDHAWLLTQFQVFLNYLQEHMEEKAALQEQAAPGAEAPARVRPVRTPRSEIPLQAARPAELLRPEFSKGRLYFSCPCCRFPAALPVWLAGKKARCPRCYSAIRAPHPRKGLNTRVLENDIESILHPERFTRYNNAHRLIPWLGLPRPKFHPAFHLAGVVVLMAVLALWIPTLMRNASHQMERLTAAFRPVEEAQGPDFKDRARRVVEQFLAAENPDAKAAFVREPDRVRDLMADWYRRHPGGRSMEAKAVEVSGAGFYAGSVTHPVSDVRVEMPDGETAFFTVEHLPSGDRIEWESSVGYTADFTSLIQKGPSAGTQPMRVMAALDDYYNFAFPDATKHVCIRLHDPATLEFLGYGYVPATLEQAGPIATQLAGSSIEDLRPLMIEVQPVEGSDETKQVAITRMLQQGWRTAGSAAASVK